MTAYRLVVNYLFYFFNDTATTEIYTLSLHDALPISSAHCRTSAGVRTRSRSARLSERKVVRAKCAAISGSARQKLFVSSSPSRSEEHTSELQSRQYLVCRLLLEKKQKPQRNPIIRTR